MSETIWNIAAVIGLLSIGATIGIVFMSIFMNSGRRPSEDVCPPCQGDCDQGRQCRARKE